MQSSLYQKTETYLSDVNFHLENLKQWIDTLQLDCNQEKLIFLFCEKASEKLVLIDRLLNSANLSTPIKISPPSLFANAAKFFNTSN